MAIYLGVTRAIQIYYLFKALTNENTRTEYSRLKDPI